MVAGLYRNTPGLKTYQRTKAYKRTKTLETENIQRQRPLLHILRGDPRASTDLVLQLALPDKYLARLTVLGPEGNGRGKHTRHCIESVLYVCIPMNDKYGLPRYRNRRGFVL